MADPIVTITNGIPVSSVPATGTITTLGQTLVDGANITLGATTDAAATGAGTINAHLRSIATNISGGIPITGTVTVAQGSPPWTVKPDGTAWTFTGTSANVNVTNASIAVTGTFWQTTQPVSGTVTANQGGTWNITNISGTISLPTGAATSANQPTNAAIGSTTSGQTGTLALGAVTTAAPAYTTAQTNPLSLNTAGGLRVDGSGVTQPVSGTVTANQGGTWTVQPGNTANTTAWLVTGTGGTFPVTGTIAATQSGTWTVQQGTPPWLVGGDVASGSADSGNPVKMGGVARTANPTAVTNGQRVNAIFDKLGKQIVVGAVRDVKGVQKTSITVATETTVVTAGAAGVFNDVYAIVVTNKSATGVFVDFKDATAGTTRMTLAAPANDTRGFTVAVDSAMVQATAANNWTATVSSAVSSIEITMLYVSNL